MSNNGNQNNGNKSQPPPPPKEEAKAVQAAPSVLNMSNDQLMVLLAGAFKLAKESGPSLALGGNPEAGDNAARAAMNDRCSTCGQLKLACKNKHTKLVVWPSRNDLAYDQKNQLQWPGVRVNGVFMRSPDGSTPIPVPAENDIPHMIQMWEEEEANMRYGRRKPLPPVWTSRPQFAVPPNLSMQG